MIMEIQFITQKQSHVSNKLVRVIEDLQIL
jgi:hypothetical protein